jgi:transketolase
MAMNSAPLPATKEGSRLMANAIRALAMDAVEAAKSGHPGMPMGMADVATVLFYALSEIRSPPILLARPRPLRAVRRHGSMLLYALLYLTGYPGIASKTSSVSGSLAAPAPAIPSMARFRESKPPQVHSVRASPTPSAWRSPNES